MERYSRLCGIRPGSRDKEPRELGCSGELNAFVRQLGIMNIQAGFDEVGQDLSGFKKLPGYDALPLDQRPMLIRYTPIDLASRPNWASDVLPFLALCASGLDSRNEPYHHTYFFRQSLLVHSGEFNYLDHLFGTRFAAPGEKEPIDYDCPPDRVEPCLREEDSMLVKLAVAAIIKNWCIVLKLEKGCSFGRRSRELLAQIYSLLPPALAAQTGFASYQDPRQLPSLLRNTRIRVFLTHADCGCSTTDRQFLVFDLNQPLNPQIANQQSKGFQLNKALVTSINYWYSLPWRERQPLMELLFAGSKQTPDEQFYCATTRSFVLDPFIRWINRKPDQGSIGSLEELKKKYDSFPICERVPILREKFCAAIPELLTPPCTLSSLTTDACARLAQSEQGSEEFAMWKELSSFGQLLLSLMPAPQSPPEAPAAAPAPQSAAGPAPAVSAKQQEQHDPSHAHRLAQLQQQLEQQTADHTRQLSDLRKQHAEQLAALEQSCSERIAQTDAEMETLRKEHAAQLKAMESEIAEIFQSMNAEHQETLDALRKTHARQLAELEQSGGRNAVETARKKLLQAHEAELAVLRQAHAEALAKKEQALTEAKAAHDKLMRDYMNTCSSLKQLQDDALTVSNAQKALEEKLRKEQEQAMWDFHATLEKEKADSLLRIRKAEEETATAREAREHLVRNYEARLASLNQTHADAVAKLEQQHARDSEQLRQSLEDAKKQMETAQLQAISVQDELTAARNAAAELEQSHQKELSRLKLAHVTARKHMEDALAHAAAERSELTAAHTAAVAKLEQQHAQDSEQLRQSLEDAKKQMETAQLQTISVQDELIAARNATAELEQRHQKELSRLKLAHVTARKHMEDALARANAERDELTAAHTAAVAKLEQDHGKELEQLNLAHDVALAAAQKQLAEAQTQTAALRDSLTAEHTVAVTKLKQNHRLELEQLNLAHDVALAAARKQLAEAQAETTTLRDSLTAEHNTAVTKLEQAHSKELEQLQQAKDASLAAVQKQLTEAQAQTADLRDSLTAEYNAAVTKLKQHHRQELDQLNLAHDVALMQTANAVRKELEEAKAKTASIRDDLTAEHNAAVTKLVQNHRLELEQLKVNHVADLEQATNAARKELEEARAQVSSIRANLTAEHNTVIAGLKQEHADACEQLQRKALADADAMRRAHQQELERVEQDYASTFNQMRQDALTRVKEVQAEVQAAETRLVLAQNEIKKLKLERDKALTQADDDLEQRVREAVAAEQKKLAAAHEAELASMGQSISKVTEDALDAERRKLEQQHQDDLEQQKQKYIAAYDEFRSGAMEHIRKAEEETKALQGKLTASELTNTELQKKLDTFTKSRETIVRALEQAYNEKLSAKDQELAGLHKKQADLEKTIAELSNAQPAPAAEPSASDPAVARLIEQAVAAERETLSAKIDDIVASAQKKLSAKDQELSELHKKQADLEKTIAELSNAQPAPAAEPSASDPAVARLIEQAVAAERETLTLKLNQTFAEQIASINQNTAEARQQLEQKHAQEIAQINQKTTEARKMMEQKHDAQIAQMNQDFSDARKKLLQKHANEIVELKWGMEKQIDDAVQNSAARIKELELQLAKARQSTGEAPASTDSVWWKRKK